MEPTDQEIVDYLLGNIAEPEQVRIEENLFTGEEFFERLSAIESRLIDLYVLDGLSASERQLFEEKYLISPRRHAALATSTKFVQLVDTYKRRQQSQPPTTWWASLKSFFESHRFLLEAAFATLLLVVSIGFFWLLTERSRLRNRTTLAEAELRQKQEELRRLQEQAAAGSARDQAELNRKLKELEASEATLKQREDELREAEARAANGAGAYATLVLSSTLRSLDTRPPALQIRPNNKYVRLIIYLKETPAEQYRATLQRVSGEDAWSNIVPKPQGSSRKLTLTIPSSAFKDFNYFVRIEGLTKSGEPVSSEEYSLAVRR